jgi:activator of HSP90 ATPase
MNEKDKTDIKAKNLGFQYSIRKTFQVSVDTLWEFILSEQGISIWLGTMDMADFELNKSFKTSEGIEGKITTFKPDCHFRMSWKPPHWDKPSIVEVRITNYKGKASMVIHQTRFFEFEKREEMKIYWENVIEKMIVELKKVFGN